MTDNFTPRWASPPGRTIQAVLRERGLTTDDLATLIRVDAGTAEELVTGAGRITTDLAARLGESIGPSARFWSLRYEQYQEDLRRLEADRWAASAPADLTGTLGWIPKTQNWVERIDNLLDFFAVDTLDEWRQRYEPVVEGARYRTTKHGPNNPVAVAAWLRRGQQIADTLSLEPWDRDRFASQIARIRKLTWLRDPAVFLPRLADACAHAGVAFALIRPPTGCLASGAALIAEGGRPLIVLSGRYRSDDHFWFTFLHEAAHVLHGDIIEPVVDNLEPEDITHPVDEIEAAANRWAADQILPSDLRAGLTTRRPTHSDIQYLARKAGVAPGLIVGHLQHSGILGYERLNKLKRRYKWNGPSLETA